MVYKSNTMSENSPVLNNSEERFCNHHFGRNRNCKFAEECKWSHDEDAYKTHHNLKNCTKCGNFCRGNYCRDCTIQHKALGQELHEQALSKYGKNCEMCGKFDLVRRMKTREDKPAPGESDGRFHFSKVCLDCSGKLPCEWCGKSKGTFTNPPRFFAPKCKDCHDIERSYVL